MLQRRSFNCFVLWLLLLLPTRGVALLVAVVVALVVVGG